MGGEEALTTEGTMFLVNASLPSKGGSEERLADLRDAAGRPEDLLVSDAVRVELGWLVHSFEEAIAMRRWLVSLGKWLNVTIREQ